MRRGRAARRSAPGVAQPNLAVLTPRRRGLQHSMLVALLLSQCEGAVRITRVAPDGKVKTELAQDCKDLAPGVTLCNDLALTAADGSELKLEVRSLNEPTRCPAKLEKDSMFLAHYTGRVVTDAGGDTESADEPFAAVTDFTDTAPLHLGSSSSSSTGWDLVLVGLCEGQKLVIDMPPELGPTDVRAPAGARLRYEMEVVIRLRIGGDKLPIKPNLFRVIDVDGDHALSEGELRDRESKRSRNPHTPPPPASCVA